MLSFLLYILRIILVLTLPFAILLRTATYFHSYLDFAAWSSIGLSALITTFVVFVYFSFFYGFLTGRLGSFTGVKRRAWLALAVVIFYTGNGVLFFSSQNLKSEELQSEMSSLHPILKLSLSTLVYLDSELIVTDARRTLEDYDKMGLKRNESSLHFPQKSTGYVHAVDLRTRDRPEVVNFLISSYFRVLGFDTLRHGGTADHLHVSLPV